MPAPITLSLDPDSADHVLNTIVGPHFQRLASSAPGLQPAPPALSLAQPGPAQPPSSLVPVTGVAPDLPPVTLPGSAPTAWNRFIKPALTIAGEGVGTMLAPEVMPLIPGTPQHTAMEQGLNKQAADTQLTQTQAQSLQADTALKQAGTWHPIPGTSSEVNDVTGATRDTGANALKLPGQWFTTPDGQTSFIPNGGLVPAGATITPKSRPTNQEVTFDDLISQGMSPLDAYKQIASAGRTGAANSPGSAYAKVRAAADLMSYAYRYDPRLLPTAVPAMQEALQQVLSNNGQPPTSGQPAPVGGSTAAPALPTLPSGLPAGWPVDANGNPIGMQTPGAPTASTRSMGQRAGILQPEITDAYQLIDAQKGELGPLVGRWNKAKQSFGDVDPQYQKLASTLETIASGLTKAHLNSEWGGEQFLSLLNSGKLTADDLKASLDVLGPYVERMTLAGEGQTGASRQTKQSNLNLNQPKEQLNLGTPVYLNGKLIGHSSDGGKTMIPVGGKQ